MGRKFGWRSGELHCQDIKCEGDLYIQDDIIFSDVSAGALSVTGGIDLQSTTSAIGIDLGGTYSTAAINVDGTTTAALKATVTSSDNGAIYLIISGRDDVTTGYEKMFYLDGTLDSTGSAGGVKTRGMEINLERTSATVTNGDSRDTGLNVYIKDKTGDHTAGYLMRGMDVKAELEASGTTITNLYAAQFCAEVDEGTVTDYMVVTVNSKVDGVVTNDAIALRVYDASQGTVSGDHIGLQFTTLGDAPESGIRDYVMEVTCADSTGWQNLFSFTDATGGTTTVDTDAACNTDGVDSDGAIRIDVNGTEYFIPFFSAANTTNSW